MKMIKLLFPICYLTTSCSDSVYSQGILENTHDKNSENNIKQKQNNKIIIVNAKHMDADSIHFYSGGKLGFINDNNNGGKSKIYYGDKHWACYLNHSTWTR